MYFTFKRKVNDQWNIILLYATMIRFSKTYAHFVLLWSIAKTKQFRSYSLYWAQNHICLVKFYLFLENNKVLLLTDFVLWLNCVTLIVKQIVTSPQVTCSRCAFEDNQDEKSHPLRLTQFILPHKQSLLQPNYLSVYDFTKITKETKLTHVPKEHFAHRHGQSWKHNSFAFKIVKCKETQYDLF